MSQDYALQSNSITDIKFDISRTEGIHSTDIASDKQMNAGYTLYRPSIDTELIDAENHNCNTSSAAPVQKLRNEDAKTNSYDYVGDSSSESDEDFVAVTDDRGSIEEKLADWSIQFNISMSALASLPYILRNFHQNLPVDPRTLWKHRYITTSKI